MGVPSAPFARCDMTGSLQKFDVIELSGKPVRINASFRLKAGLPENKDYPVLKICVIETDDDLRSAIYRYFRDANIPVEPFQNFDEFEKWNSAESVIVCSADNLIDLAISTRAAALPHWNPIVVYASKVSRRQVVDLMNLGAIDVLQYPDDLENLPEHLVAWRALIARASSGERRRRVARALIASLTKREFQTLTGIANGKSSKDIGEELGTNARTVEIYKSKIFEKLSVRTSAAAVRIFCESSEAG